MQKTQWDFQNKGTLTSPAQLSFVFKVPLRQLRTSIIYSIPCDWILQRGYCRCANGHQVNLIPGAIPATDLHLIPGMPLWG